MGRFLCFVIILIRVESYFSKNISNVGKILQMTFNHNPAEKMTPRHSFHMDIYSKNILPFHKVIFYVVKHIPHHIIMSRDTAPTKC